MQQNQRQFDWFYPLECEQFPAIEDYDGVIVFGGASSANDESSCDWIARELTFVEQVLHTETPFFGICLGAQILARVLGSPVFKHPQDEKEVGFCEVFPTPDSGDFLDKGQFFMQWHSEGFDLPADCKSIATGHVFANQGFQYRDSKVFGVQFHPEINPQALAIWHERNRRKNPNPLTDAQRLTHMQDAHLHDSAITAWMDGFLHRWTAQAGS